MKFTRLGQTGLVISRLCLGCMSYGDTTKGRHGDWLLGEEDSRPFFRAALEGGINFFDTANIYAGGTSEEITGKLLTEMARRDEIVVATKAYGPWRMAPNTRGNSRKALMQAVDDSLKRLGMDYVDLFQIHRWDDDTPIEETMEALNDIVKAGKALYIGASSMYAWQFAKAQETARAKWLDALCLDAEPAQPALPRGRARNAAPVRRRRRRRDPVEPARTRPPGKARGGDDRSQPDRWYRQGALQ